jgi:hypothetical protein
LLGIINKSLDKRKVRDNQENETSSRSHVIVTIYETVQRKKSGRTFIYKYTFVDLAGAERVAKLEISPKLYLEAVFINESLETLQ